MPKKECLGIKIIKKPFGFNILATFLKTSSGLSRNSKAPAQNIVSKKNLAKKSILFEQKILDEIVGSQDQIASVYGGFNRIEFKVNGDFLVKKINLNKNKMEKLNKNLILIYTGYKRTAHDIAKSYVNKLKSTKEKNILRILSFVEEGEKILKGENLNDFGKLLHESWLEKKNLSSAISNSSIDEIYNIAIKNGALGGKLLGAGGGGFFLMVSYNI